MIFPSWTARCNDLEFRNWAEDLVRENCPAHITPEIYCGLILMECVNSKFCIADGLIYL